MKNPNKDHKFLSKSLRGRMSRQYQSNGNPIKDKLFTLSKLEYYLNEENRRDNVYSLHKSPSQYEKDELDRGGVRLLPGKSSKNIVRKISLDPKMGNIEQELFRETSSKKLIKSILDTS